MPRFLEPSTQATWQRRATPRLQPRARSDPRSPLPRPRKRRRRRNGSTNAAIRTGMALRPGARSSTKGADTVAEASRAISGRARGDHQRQRKSAQDAIRHSQLADCPAIRPSLAAENRVGARSRRTALGCPLVHASSFPEGQRKRRRSPGRKWSAPYWLEDGRTGCTAPRERCARRSNSQERRATAPNVRRATAATSSCQRSCGSTPNEQADYSAIPGIRQPPAARHQVSSCALLGATARVYEPRRRCDRPLSPWWHPLATYDSICAHPNRRATTVEPGNRFLLGGYPCALL